MNPLSRDAIKLLEYALGCIERDNTLPIKKREGFVTALKSLIEMRKVKS